MAANGKHAYDVVVIGAGNGGLVAAIRVLQAGYSCLLVEKHNISPDRSANILDAVSCAAMCLIPYGFAPLLTYMFAGGSGAPVNFSVNQMVLFSFHGWGLAVVMLFSMITGWGRTTRLFCTRCAYTLLLMDNVRF